MSEKESNGGLHHEHDENCNHEHDTVFITFEDDKEVECNVIGVFEYDNKEYIAINPVEDEEILIYSYEESEDGASINFIEDDAEYESVTGEFYKLFEEDPDDLTEYDDFYLDEEDDESDFEDEEV